MRYKNLVKKAMVLAALAGLLPMATSALTIQELSQAAKQPKVLGDSTYAALLLTSSTNTSMKIKVQAQSYSGGLWSYQICWVRTRNATGSLYVYLKSDSSQKVLSEDSASQSGCDNFVSQPSTAYRVDFYSQASGAGTLLVRKSFTTNDPLNNNTASAGSYSSNNSSTLTATTGSTIYWPVSSLSKDPNPSSASNPYCKNGTQSCYQTPDSVNPEANYDLSLKHSTPDNSSQWVVEYNYRSVETGKCMHYDATGNRTEITCYSDHPLPTASDTYVPTFNDSTFRFDLANAKCAYTGAYTALKNWGHSELILCTGYGGTAWGSVPYSVVDSGAAAPVSSSSGSGTYSNASNTSGASYSSTTSGSATYKTVAQLLQEQYGITWNTTNLPKDPQPLATNNYYSPNYIAALPSQTVGLAYVNANKGESVQMVLAINYTDGNGRCYHADFSTGTKVVTQLTCYADHPLPTITGAVPAPTDANVGFPWSLANAQCIYIAGNNQYKNPGASHFNSCGGSDSANIPGPTTTVNLNEQVLVSYNGLPMDTDPYNPSNPYAPRTDNHTYPLPTIETGLKLVDANGGKSVLWVQSFLYKDSSGNCRSMDGTSGSFVVSNIQCYANHPLPTWTQSTPPAQNDTTFDWTMSNAQCLYTAGRDKPIPGASELISCGVAGVNRVAGNFQTPIYPVSPTVQLPSDSDTAIVSSIIYRQVAAATSGSGNNVCYKTQRVKGANSLYPDQYTMVTNQTACPDPLPPVLVVGQVPSAHDSNFDWVSSKASCVRKADNTPVACGTSAASVGTNGKCGTVAGQIFSSLTSGASGLCSVGTLSGFSGSGPWSWQCTGSNGGATASCSAYANSSQLQAGQQSLYSLQSSCLASGGVWADGTNTCVQSSSSAKNNSSIVTAPSSGYSGQKVTLSTPNLGGISAFLNFSSSNSGVCAVSPTVYVNPKDVNSLPYCTCSAKGTAVITVTGSGFPTSTQTVTCN